MADLKKIGLILVLIDGILIILNGIQGLLGSVFLDFSIPGAGLVALSGTAASIVAIIVGIVLIAFFTGKLSVGDDLILAIVIIVLGVTVATFLTLLGGILILIEKLT